MTDMNDYNVNGNPVSPSQGDAGSQHSASEQQSYSQSAYGQNGYTQGGYYSQPGYYNQNGYTYGQPTYGQAYNQTYSQTYGQASDQQKYSQQAYDQQIGFQSNMQTPSDGSGKQPSDKKDAKAEKKASKKKRHLTFWNGVAATAVVCAIGLGGVALWDAFADDTTTDDSTTTEETTTEETTDDSTTTDESTEESTDEDSTDEIVLGATETTEIEVDDTETELAVAVAAKCLPSVCNIDVYVSESSYYSDYYEYYFGYDYDSEDSDSDDLTLSSLGSGVVLTEDGYILTNYHVIEGAEALEVTVDGETYEAEVIGYDSSSDIAVIKAVDASGLTPIEIGDSDDLQVGEWVMSIGSPFGLEQSVATGIVSAIDRSEILESETEEGEYTIYPNMIQTDAAINPGNSGGALVNSDGQLIGINTLITSYSGSYSGVGFAIPVNYAISIAEQIIAGETPTHAQLGVSLMSLTSSIAERYGLDVDEGAYVTAVYSDTGAADAGIQEGDVIIAFDGEDVESATDLMIYVRTKDPGDTVTITLVRDGETMDVEVTLGSDEEDETEEEESTDELSDDSESDSDSDDSDMLDRLFDNDDSSDGYGDGYGNGMNDGYGYGYDFGMSSDADSDDDSSSGDTVDCEEDDETVYAA